MFAIAQSSPLTERVTSTASPVDVHCAHRRPIDLRLVEDDLELPGTISALCLVDANAQAEGELSSEVRGHAHDREPERGAHLPGAAPIRESQRKRRGVERRPGDVQQTVQGRQPRVSPRR